MSEEPKKMTRNEMMILVLNAVVTLAILILTVDIVLDLLRAGEDTLGLGITVIGGATTLLAPRIKDIQLALENLLRVDDKIVALLLQVALFIVIGLARGPFFETLSRQYISEGLRTADIIEAQNAFYSARFLDGDVVEPLRTELLRTLDTAPPESRTESAVRLARLYAIFSDDRARLSDEITERTCEAAIATRQEDTITLMQVLTILDSAAANRLAGNLNDASALALADQAATNAHFESTACRPLFAAENLTDDRARVYLETLFAVDAEAFNRANAIKSISRFNLGFLREQEAQRPNYLQNATEAYSAAIDLNPSNTEARDALASLWLIYSGDFPQETLTRAVDITRIGREVYLEPMGVCGEVQSEATYQAAWDCFRMLTLEAGARLKRNDPTLGDSGFVIESLLNRAADLAEANAQFTTQAGHYTAEAYYYLALVKGEGSELLDLCRIQWNRDLENPRHRTWLEYSIGQREALYGETACPNNPDW